MRQILFDYPKNAVFGRVLPKSKIYQHTNPKTALKELFIRQVEQVVWQYKLAPETINLSPSPTVSEIQIFTVTLKTGDIQHDVLECIDQAITHPIVFELYFGEKVKAIAAFKSTKNPNCPIKIVSNYFESTWMPRETTRIPLPMVLDFDLLYSSILAPLLPFPARPGERLDERVDRMEQIRSKQRELEKCEICLRREKQFNRKVALNAALRKLKQEIEILTQEQYQHCKEQP